MSRCIYWSINACLPKEENNVMCDSIQTNEQQTQVKAEEQRDVDDLIFRHEKEWLASDR